MKAAVLHELGKAPRCEEFAEPIAGKDEAVVRVRSASLKAVDRQLAAGSHYASARELPVVCGTDGVGDLEDGTRVFFGGPRRPYGAKAERTVVPRAFCFPAPAGIDDDTVAALPNPGVSAWLSLTQRAKLAPGETVLILDATGVTGQLAVQIAKLLGAKRVIGAGRTALTILGTAGIPSREVLVDAMQQVMARAARRELRIETERVPLADIERVWQRQGQSGRRIVVVP